jgi:hypothetical protein
VEEIKSYPDFRSEGRNKVSEIISEMRSEGRNKCPKYKSCPEGRR